MEDGLLKLSGATEPVPDKYTSLAFIRFIAGLQTQRSAYASIDLRYSVKYLGGKPDALIDGLNVEINNKLTPQRRPGVVAYGTSIIPPPVAFDDWNLATTSDIILMVDTAIGGGDNQAGANGAIFNYSPTHSGIYVNKAPLSGQTNFYHVANTLYMGNGVDLYKIVGPNLLTQSNNFGTGANSLFTAETPWTATDVFSMTPGQVDPLGTSTATQVVWSATDPGAIIEQDVLPNYTPIPSNTFTFSVWMKRTGGPISVHLQIADQYLSLADTNFALTTSWAKYQVTGTMNSNSNVIKVRIYNPSTTNTMVIYGAQLEVGGPATTTQVTTIKPQGVWLWGITAPTVVPTAVPGPIIGNQWLPDHLYNLGDTITDTNGNQQTVTNAGESGAAPPAWNVVRGGVTSDGLQNLVVQSTSTFVSASTVSLAFTANVTVSDSLFAFIVSDIPNATYTVVISDNMGNTWVKIAQSDAGDLHELMYTVRSAAAGATTITVTVSSPTANSIWLAIGEVNALLAVDVSKTNSARDYTGTLFNTGVVTTTNGTGPNPPNDFLITFAAFVNNVGFSSEIGVPPNGFQPIAAQQGVLGRPGGHYLNMGVYCETLNAATVINPSWSITAPQNANGLVGITAAIHSSIGTLQWTNTGPVGITALIGYIYYYSYANSYTGHPSNVSPASGTNALGTGPVAGQSITISGATRTMTQSGGYSVDPQSDLIPIYRNADGGAFFYQLGVIGNGAAAQAALASINYPGLLTNVTYGAGTWTLTDTTPDNQLNTSIFAPIGLLNTPPPAGLVNLEYFAGRMWGSVGNNLYYNSGADNASLLNITQNAVPSEAWAAANYVPFNDPIVRSIAVGGGLLVFTTNDMWFVTGQNLLTGGFNPSKQLVNHGLQSYNAATVDGSSVYIYTSDRQNLIINANSGSVEPGYPIGDLLEDTFNPTSVYLARHVSGSRDNAVYFADGVTGWFRLNPNQQGASMSGEATAVWSPKADFTATITGMGANSSVASGIGAIASIQTAPGIIQLLVGQRSFGPVLVRNLNTFTDNGNAYTWSATIGSIVLTTPGKLAEVESITIEMDNRNSSATQCSVGVLLDEIGGTFESLPNSVNDPPQLATSTSVLSRRFYLSQGAVPPIVRHMQFQISGGETTLKDEIIGITLRGAMVPEQQ